MTLARGVGPETFSGRRVELRIDSLTEFVTVTNHSDQPWKIARMNKFTYALALGAGLVLSLAAPSVQAAPIIQTLSPTTMTTGQYHEFSALFTPSTSVLTQNYQFMNTPTTGVVESQVFTGKGAAAGLYAYGYQFGVSDVKDGTGQPTSVNSASMVFNATPVPFQLAGQPASATYVVTGEKVGNIDLPAAAPGSIVQTPSSIAWQPGTKTGSLTFQYLDATSNTGPLEAGAKSGTIVVITSQPPTQQYVSVQNPNPQTVYPQAYSPVPGTIAEVPAPEPTAIVAWTGVIGALALARRVRRNRTPA